MICNRKIYHIVWVTHNSRISERMKTYNVKMGKPMVLTLDDEIEITGFIRDIVMENKYIILAYNICQHHVHLIFLCSEEERDQSIGNIKGKSAYLYKKSHEIKNTFHLWAQKFNKKEITSYKQLMNTFKYIQYNRYKHDLPPNRALRPIILQMLTSIDKGLDILQGIQTPCK